MDLLVIGCGAIGSSVAAYAQKDPSIGCVYIHDHSGDKMKFLARTYSKCKVASSISACLKGVNLVFEAASQEAVREFALQVLKAKKDIVIMSVGALADDALRESLVNEAKAQGVKIILPSGACGGFDALAAAKHSDVVEVKLIATKPPKGFHDSPYIRENKIDLSSLSRPTVIFTGSARDAVRAFPANVNIAATVSIAGIGFDKTVVEIVCDPFAKRNVHCLYAKGSFGEFKCEFSNIPSPDNPRTSYIATLSAIKCISHVKERGIVVI
jgi:aspartate dehydrogenase